MKLIDLNRVFDNNRSPAELRPFAKTLQPVDPPLPSPSIPPSTLPFLATTQPVVDLPEDWQLLWDERAAIMEYDGNLPREVAEHLALVEIIAQMKKEQKG